LSTTHIVAVPSAFEAMQSGFCVHMTEAEKTILIQTIAEEVEDIVKGKATSSFAVIQKRLRRLRSNTKKQPTKGLAPVRLRRH
jgi:hypothetical protein